MYIEKSKNEIAVASPSSGKKPGILNRLGWQNWKVLHELCATLFPHFDRSGDILMSLPLIRWNVKRREIISTLPRVHSSQSLSLPSPWQPFPTSKRASASSDEKGYFAQTKDRARLHRVSSEWECHETDTRTQCVLD